MEEQRLTNCLRPSNFDIEAKIIYTVGEALKVLSEHSPSTTFALPLILPELLVINRQKPESGKHNP
jgi:hypothetical protein